MAEKVRWYRAGSKKSGYIYFKKHPSRKVGVHFDCYYRAEYQFNGKRTPINFGWWSEGWSESKCLNKMKEYRENAKSGKGPTCLTEERAIEEEKKAQQELSIQQRAKDQTNVHDFFYEEYFPQIRKEKKLKTAGREESLFRIWIDNPLGKKQFNQITKSDIENIFYNIVDSGKSLRTAEYCLTTLKQVWREAISNGYAGSMPEISKTVKKRLSTNDNQRLRYLSHAEADQLLDELGKVSETVFEQALISLHCGLRAGEILSLTWGCVNIENSELFIIDAKGKDRTVYMTQAVKDILASKAPGKPLDLVFTGRNGQSNQISQTFRQVAEKLFNKGVTDRRLRVSFHSLRHTCASWMVMQGISLYLVQKVLGHSTIQVTERYSHLAPNQLALAAGAIDRGITEHRDKNIIPFKKEG